MYKQPLTQYVIRALGVTTLMVGTLLVGIPGQTQGAPREAELQQLRSEIQSLQNNLKSSLNERDDLRGELAKLEKRIGGISRKLKDLARQQRQLEGELPDLQKRKQAAQQQLDIHFQTLRDYVKTGYAIGRQGMVKMLLNQQDPTQVGRSLSYYHYLNQARLTRIDGLNHHLSELDSLEGEIRQRVQALDEIKRNTLASRKDYQQDRAARLKLLARLETQIADQGRRLQQLEEDRRQLEILLEGLRDTTRVPSGPIDTPFAKRRGHMPWPAKGKLSARFGSPRDSGKLKWQGIMIDTVEGAQVHAIAAGRVIFADWMRGYGLLLIIDHDDGYMSLYGHNQALHQELGDWVADGELIASAGDSGGRNQAGLYFEIRYQGKPSNPLVWLKK